MKRTEESIKIEAFLREKKELVSTSQISKALFIDKNKTGLFLSHMAKAGKLVKVQRGEGAEKQNFWGLTQNVKQFKK
jgi:hypothetical protein